MSDTNPSLRPILEDLIQDLQSPDVMSQLGMVFLCLMVAWFVSQWAVRRWGNPDPELFSNTSALLNRMSFPLLGLGMLWLVVVALEGAARLNLVKLAFTLTAALGVIRLLVYVMRRIFSNRRFLNSFERSIELCVWVAVALYISGLGQDTYDFLQQYEIRIAKTRLSFATILEGILAVCVTMVVAMWGSASVERRLMASELDPSTRVVLARAIKALTLVVALVFSLSIVGIDLTVLSVFGGALGVGLGFGLQRIASNYVSGFIILLDRSIRIGDMIAVDKFTGTVSEIKTRYTVIHAIDGMEAIVPNEMLINAPVSNYAYTDKMVSSHIRLQVSYDSDLDTAMGILREAALAQARVLSEPVPKVFVVEFAADGITLDLTFWLIDPETGTMSIKSDIYLYIYRAFKQQGIEIPYPQRVIQIVSKTSTT